MKRKEERRRVKGRVRVKDRIGGRNERKKQNKGQMP